MDDAVEQALQQFGNTGDADGRDNGPQEHTGDVHEREQSPEQKSPGDKSEDTHNESSKSEGDSVPKETQQGPRASAWATFHKQQKEHQEKVAAFAQEKAELQKFKDAVANAKVDRLAALELLGYEDPRAFIEGIAEDGGRMTPERKELYELKKWRDKQEQTQKELQQRQQQEALAAQQQQRLDSLKTNIVNTIKGEFGDGLVSMPGGVDAVLNQMNQMAAENPETMPRIQDAISAVEKMYTTQIAALFENPKAQKLAQQYLASSKPDKSVAAPSHRPVPRTIGSDATPRSTAQRDNYVPTISGDAEVEDAIARFLRPRSI